MKFACAVVVFVVCGTGALGAAQERPSAGTAMLDYRAGATCPERREFIDMVQSRIGYFAFRDDAAESIEVELAQSTGRHFEATIRQRPAATEARRLEGSTCGELAEAAATVIALQLDPFGENAAAHQEATREELSPELENLSHEEPPVEVREVELTPPVETAPPWGLAICVDVLGSLGRVPTAGLGFGLGLRLTTRNVHVELGADIELTPGTVSSEGRDLFAYAPSALLRASYRIGVLDLGALVRAGAIVVRSTELNTQVRAATASLGALAGLSFQAGNTTLRASVLGEVAVNRVDVFFADALTWASRRFSLGLRLGVTFGVTR